MTSTSAPRYQPHPELFHWKLRMYFLYFLVREQTYVDVQQGLAPLWQDVLAQYPGLDPQLPFAQLPASSAPDDSLNRYFSGLRSEVSNHLRCREHGAPAGWVCHALHGGVTGAPFDAGAAVPYLLWHGTLDVPVGSDGVAMVLAKINGTPLSSKEEVEEASINQQQPGTPFTQWKKLTKLAHQELNHLLESLRVQVDSATAEWPRLNQQGFKTRTQVTMEKLVHWVVGREEQFAGDRSATNDLLKELRLDPPGKLEKNTQSPDFSSEKP